MPKKDRGIKLIGGGFTQIPCPDSCDRPPYDHWNCVIDGHRPVIYELPTFTTDENPYYIDKDQAAYEMFELRRGQLKGLDMLAKCSKDYSKGGKRYNEGKPPLHLIPSQLLYSVAKVLGFGAKKYGTNNWKKGLSFNETIDSAIRHLLKFKDGENIDEESGESHLGHAATNISFLLCFMEHGKGNDDREVDNGE